MEIKYKLSVCIKGKIYRHKSMNTLCQKCPSCQLKLAYALINASAKIEITHKLFIKLFTGNFNEFYISLSLGDFTINVPFIISYTIEVRTKPELTNFGRVLADFY